MGTQKFQTIFRQGGFKIAVHIITVCMTSVAYLSLLRYFRVKVEQLNKRAHLSNILHIVPFLVHKCLSFVAMNMNSNCEIKPPDAITDDFVTAIYSDANLLLLYGTIYLESFQYLKCKFVEYISDFVGR